MKKKWHLRFISLIAALMLLCNSALASQTTEAAIRLQDDFYEAVNAEWLTASEIPANKYSIGGFSDLHYEVEDLLMADFDKMLDGDTAEEGTELAEFLKFYEMAANYENRNAQGSEPLLQYLDQVDALDNLDALDVMLADWTLNGMPTPFAFSVMADMGDATTNALYLSAPSVLLPDVSYYDTETGDQLLAYFSQLAQHLLVLAGKTEEDASSTVEQALAFDRMLVPYVKTAEENSDMALLYNPISFEELEAYGGSLHLGALAKAITGANPEEIIVTDPKYFEVYDEIVTEENFQLLKSWMSVMTAWSMASYLSEEFETAVASYTMILSGQTELDAPRKRAYSLASSIYSMVIGDYYGRAYFGDEAKSDVTGMVENMIEVYILRLNENDWLSEETIQSAINKLDNMSIQIGYPDSIPPIYAKLKADPDGTLLGNAMAFSRIILEDHYVKFGTPVNPDEWSIGAHVVNAMYSPLTNTIIFPAAILQAPFYSIDQTASQNYGGIGSVIAHEITHAFDPNGSQFDEYGNMKNWWTEEDYAAFEERTEKVKNLFNGMEFAGGTVNGALTVSENTADAGGLSCALEIVKSLPDANLEEFFTNWAVIWRIKSSPEYEQLLLAVDSHAPNKLRANVQLQNLEDFYETFAVTEGDGMYLAPEDRVSVW